MRPRLSAISSAALLVLLSGTSGALAQPRQPDPPEPETQRGQAGRVPSAGAVRRQAEERVGQDESDDEDAQRRLELRRQLGAQARDRVAQDAEPEGEPLTLDAFSDAVELRTLIDLVAAALEIEVLIRGDVTGSVSFASRREVPQGNLLEFLSSLLDLNSYALTYDEATGFFIVQEADTVRPALGGPLATTRVIGTPNVRPSALESALQTALGGGGASPTRGEGGGTTRGIAFVDELGVIVVTGAPRHVARVEQLVEALVQELSQLKFIRFELRHVAAQAARQRVVELLAGGSLTRLPGQAGTAPAVAAGGSRESFDNISDRLTVDAQGNALVYRARDEEIARVRELLELIDQPVELADERYFVGAAAQQIAEVASGRGLGEVVVLNDQQTQQLSTRQAFDPAGRNPLQQQSSTGGGSTLVVDVESGTIIYYGTTEQQARLANLIEELDVDEDALVTRAYKLEHADAEETVEIILGLIEQNQQTGNRGLLPTGGDTFNEFDQSFGNAAGAEGELGGLTATRDTRVVADVGNNQVLVRARLRQQEEFEKLIDRLDLRRPQVYIEATIVSVTDTERFRLAVETQLINASGTGGALQTNFGLTQAGDSFTDPRTVATGLGGLTTALIQSRYVPFVLNAIQTDTDARIVSSPSLLVDDNSEASIISIDQQPTTATTQGDATTETTFGGFEDAGTELTVTPRISEGGYLQLEYEIELSNFVGEGANGIPAPRQERTISSESVTIPSDATIVVGGINIETTGETIVKIPLLGDIPIVGQLFRDTNTNSSSATLYVFIKPRIMRDDAFRDLRLLTLGPQAEAGVALDLPPIEPSSIEVIAAVESARSRGGDRSGRTGLEAGAVRRGGGE